LLSECNDTAIYDYREYDCCIDAAAELLYCDHCTLLSVIHHQALASDLAICSPFAIAASHRFDTVEMLRKINNTGLFRSLTRLSGPFLAGKGKD
jgi:hypothetical protein